MTEMKKTWLLFAVAQVVSLSQGAIIKGPYLQDVTKTSIRIRWETDAGTDSRADYGLTASYGDFIAGTYSTYLPESGTYLHEIPLTGLNAETIYHYMVTTTGSSSADHTFRTSVNEGAPFRFAVYGDNQDGVAVHEEIVKGILAFMPRIVLHVGDVVDNGNIYSEWGSQFFAPAGDLLYITPLYVAAGNHEKWAHWVTDFIYFPTSDRWWSFDFGNAHFVILDTNTSCTVGSPQYIWLENDLAGTAQEWIFVFFHQPPFSSVIPDWGGYYTDLVTLLEASGVDVVFNGHAHLYERSYKDGITYITSGGGGGSLASPWFPNPYQVYVESTHHFCTVDVFRGELHLQAKYSNGTTFDELAITHTPTPTPTSTITPTPSPTATPVPHYIEVEASPTAVTSGSPVTLSWTCDFTTWDYRNVRVDVYLAAIQNPSIVGAPSSVSDALSGGPVYLFGPNMERAHRYCGIMPQPIFRNISFPPIPAAGSLTINTSRSPACKGNYVFATLFLIHGAGRFVRTDGRPLENSNLIQIR